MEPTRGHAHHHGAGIRKGGGLLVVDAIVPSDHGFSPAKVMDPGPTDLECRHIPEARNSTSAMPHAIVLRRPRTEEEEEFLDAHRATTPEMPNFLHYYRDGMSLGHYLEILDEAERGEGLPPGHVPSTFLFAFSGSRIVGRVAIRHRLTESLLDVGGHVGFVVVPEFRRRGYATAMLRLALPVARDRLGLDRVLVTCDDDNVGSIRAIERNGGVLENVITPDAGRPTRRYWVHTRGVSWT